MKSFFRYLGRNRLYTVVNIFGFAVSLMFAILIGDYTWRQLSMDSWHKNSDRVYLLADDSTVKSWPEATKGMEQSIPEIEQTCLVLSQAGKVVSGTNSYEDRIKPFILLTDSNFFDFFDFKLLEGNRESVLDSPENVLVTQGFADLLFPEGNPIGKPLRIIGRQNLSFGGEKTQDTTLVYTVSGIIEEIDRSALPSDISLIANVKRYPQIMGYELPLNQNGSGPWGYIKSYIMTEKGVDIPSLEEKITRYTRDNVSYYESIDGELHMHLIPQSKVIFAPQNDGAAMEKGDRGRMLILLAAVIALLFFAISNYINMTVAGAGARVKEMATRRLLGSTKREIMLKFIAESCFMVFVSFVLALALAFAFDDKVATLFSGKIDLARDITTLTIVMSLGFILFTGCIAGLIPSIQISRFSSVEVIKGAFRRHSNNVLAKVFIILQNVISVVLLTTSLVIWLQLHHLIAAPLGFETKDRYYIVSGLDETERVRSELEAMPHVARIGYANGSDFIGWGSSWNTRHLPDGRTVETYISGLDKEAMSIFGLKIVQDNGNSDGSYYVTEKLLELVDLDVNATEIQWAGGRESRIAGVLEDFHTTNILSETLPFMVDIREPEDMYYPSFVVQTDGTKAARADLEMLAEKYNSEYGEPVIVLISIEEAIGQSFDADRKTLKIIELFALVAILISVLGFVGMSLFFIRQRRKEIGVRKIMGGDSPEVGLQMLRIFCSPLLASFVIAIPISWYFMSNWLNGFSYRIGLHTWIFVATCAASMLIAVLSVSLQIGFAVRQNPVESIKAE